MIKDFKDRLKKYNIEWKKLEKGDLDILEESNSAVFPFDIPDGKTVKSFMGSPVIKDEKQQAAVTLHTMQPWLISEDTFENFENHTFIFYAQVEESYIVGNFYRTVEAND